ncbi:hypothetical protein N7451_006400 [Penicillium sp. IBT 35674x]|nr:hypothetical protein N7451_006400 [Penicillium sp. IBT 35674x]
MTVPSAVALCDVMQVHSGASNAVQSHSHSESASEREIKEHNDAIVTERKATQLFFADADLFSMSTDDRIMGLKSTRALIDGGSTLNLIPQYLIKLHGGVMEVATGERSIVPHAVWICVELHGTTRVVAMHDTGIRGDYKLGTYTILDDEGNRRKLPRAGDRSMMSEPTSSSSNPPLWATVDSADRKEDTEIPYDDIHDEDISEKEVGRTIQEALRQDYHLVHENDDSGEYSEDAESLSGI